MSDSPKNAPELKWNEERHKFDFEPFVVWLRDQGVFDSYPPGMDEDSEGSVGTAHRRDKAFSDSFHIAYAAKLAKIFVPEAIKPWLTHYLQHHKFDLVPGSVEDQSMANKDVEELFFLRPEIPAAFTNYKNALVEYWRGLSSAIRRSPSLSEAQKTCGNVFISSIEGNSGEGILIENTAAEVGVAYLERLGLRGKPERIFEERDTLPPAIIDDFKQGMNEHRTGRKSHFTQGIITCPARTAVLRLSGMLHTAIDGERAAEAFGTTPFEFYKRVIELNAERSKDATSSGHVEAISKRSGPYAGKS